VPPGLHVDAGLDEQPRILLDPRVGQIALT
jgi:hypothetical protein